MTAHDDLDAQLAKLVEKTPEGLLRTKPGRRLYRADELVRFIAARQFVGRRVRVTISPLRLKDETRRTYVGEVLAVAEGGYGLQSDVVVHRGKSDPGSNAYIIRADSLSVVESIEEIRTVREAVAHLTEGTQS